MMDYKKRREKVYGELARNGIDVFLVEDCEARRSPSLRYLSGHPSDGLLFLLRGGRSFLFPWDVPLAEKYAHADTVLPYTDFDRRPLNAVRRVLTEFSPAEKVLLALPAAMPYPTVILTAETLRREFPRLEIICADDGPDSFIEKQRILKDADELACIRGAADILNKLLASIEAGVCGGTIVTETDAALFIEKECRVLGAEGTSFATLAAGPARSFAIHAFPNYGGGPLAAPGLSILDFGVSFEGYAGDVTLTLAAGKLTPAQENILSLVQEAYETAVDLCRPGESTRRIALAVEKIFSRANVSMPHSLGHGLGLQIHEAPFLRTSETDDTILKPGMVFTIEPGLYDPACGGSRLENDILITGTGHEVLTQSRILRI